MFCTNQLWLLLFIFPVQWRLAPPLRVLCFIFSPWKHCAKLICILLYIYLHEPDMLLWDYEQELINSDLELQIHVSLIWPLVPWLPFPGQSTGSPCDILMSIKHLNIIFVPKISFAFIFETKWMKLVFLWSHWYPLFYTCNDLYNFVNYVNKKVNAIWQSFTKWVSFFR